MRQRIHYIRRSKGQANKLSQSDLLFAKHLRSAFQPAPFHLGFPDTTTLYEQLRVKEIECSLAAAAKATAGKKFSTKSTTGPTSEGNKTKSKDMTKKYHTKDKNKAKELDAES